MISLTRKTDYALVALVYLAQRWCAGAGPASAREVSDAFGLPQGLLMNALKDLARAGLIRSTRGSAGGYEMAQDPAQVSLHDVVHALEAEPDAGDAAADLDSAVLQRLHGRVDQFLQGLTLQDLLQDADESPCTVSVRMPVK